MGRYIDRGIYMRTLALAALLLPLHLACDDSSSGGGDNIPRQETTCLDVEGPAPCCEIPTFEWVEENCPEGSKFMSGVHMGNGNSVAMCATLDSEVLERAAPAGPLAQVKGSGVGAGWRSGIEADAESWSCDQTSGRAILIRNNGCDVGCYDAQGQEKECGNPCS